MWIGQYPIEQGERNSQGLYKLEGFLWAGIQGKEVISKIKEWIVSGQLIFFGGEGTGKGFSSDYLTIVNFRSTLGVQFPGRGEVAVKSWFTVVEANDIILGLSFIFNNIFKHTFCYQWKYPVNIYNVSGEWEIFSKIFTYFFFYPIHLSDFVIIVYNFSFNMIYCVFPLCLFPRESLCYKSSIPVLHSYNVTNYLELNTHFPELMAYLSFSFCILVLWIFVLSCCFLRHHQEKILKSHNHNILRF